MPLFFLLFFFQHFNSRPHGGRQVIPPDPATERHFNSRPHGGRLFRPSGMVGSSLFQLTPSRRATRFFHSSAPPKPFQLTPSRRATPKQDAKRCKRRHFNSRPHGGRHSDLSTLCLSCHFNSRPHGGRPALSFSSSQVTFISTHALTEGDKFP